MSRKLVSAGVVLALLLLIVALLVVLRPRTKLSRSAAKPAVSVPLEGSAAPDLGPASLEIADPQAYADLHSVRTTALQDVRIVEGIVRNLRESLTSTQSPPLGFNEEITRALSGRNPLEIAFVPSNHPAINARGLLCDRWGTPYHFHPVAHDRIDVRSAGPDRKLFTTDDVVSADAPPVSGPVAVPEP